MVDETSPIGVFGRPAVARVTSRGRVCFTDGSPDLGWHVAADDRWYDPEREVAVRRSDTDGLPIVSTRMRVPGGDIVHTACGGLKKERIVLSEVVIEDEEVDKHALHYLQLDSKIKELEKEKDSLKASLEGAVGVTASGVEISWTTVKGRETVDAKEVEKLLGFVPKIVGNESVRLNIKTSGGK